MKPRTSMLNITSNSFKIKIKEAQNMNNNITTTSILKRLVLYSTTIRLKNGQLVN
jgi:hypothetical protein